MDDLKKSLLEKNDKQKGRKKKEKTVVYNLDGKAKKKTPLPVRIFLVLALIFSSLAAVIYIPALQYEEPVEANDYTPITPDTTAIKQYQTILKNSPEADFDKDGLDNQLEDDYGTNIWSVDTDGDGVYDYAELFVTGTSPTEGTSILMKYVQAQDEKDGTNLETPYELNGLIFWPETYKSKTYGSAIKNYTNDSCVSYIFCYYTGWVHFPEVGMYVYRYENGVHYELPHQSAEDAYYISGTCEIRLYHEPLSFEHCLKLPFMEEKYLEDDSFIGNLLTKILPDKGSSFTCRRQTSLDRIAPEYADTMAVPALPYIDKEDASRLEKISNTLQDLTWLEKLIDAGYCAAVSLYSPNFGESIGIIYGYSEDGKLYVANEALEPAGTIQTTKKSMRIMDNYGVIGYWTWYEWKGLGFDSRRGDHISFFADTMTSSEGDSIREEPAESLNKTEKTAGPETEAITEAVTETEDITETEVATETEPLTGVITLETEAATEPQTEIETQKTDRVATFSL